MEHNKPHNHKDFNFMDTRGFSAARVPKSLPAALVAAVPQPLVPSLKRGRPAKGTVVDPVQVRAVKMPPSFWEAMEMKARKQGLSLHAAMREALCTWFARA